MNPLRIHAVIYLVVDIDNVNEVVEFWYSCLVSTVEVHFTNVISITEQ